MYRDELTEASTRVEDLSRRFEAQNEELASLRKQLAKRLGTGEPSPRRSRVRIMLVAAGAAMAATAFGAWLSARPKGRAPRDPTPMMMATSLRPSAHRSTSRRSLDPRFRIGVESPARVEQLAARCDRTVPRETLDGLPRGTRVMDFLTCQGCDCCEPGGIFPPALDEHRKPILATGDCRRCSRAWALEDAGLGVAGGREDDPLNADHGLVFTLREPARVFALRVGGSAFQTTKDPKPDHEVSLIAYDEKGRPIDGAHMSYPSWRAEGSVRNYSAIEGVVLVEACEGESIGRVDFGTNDPNVRIQAIALLPAVAE